MKAHFRLSLQHRKFIVLRHEVKARVVKQASKILGIDIDLDETCKDKVLAKAEAVVCNTNHPLNKFFIKLRSGRRWQSLRCKTNRYLNPFIPYDVYLLNDQLDVTYIS